MSKEAAKRRADYSALIESVLSPWGVWKAQPGRYRSCCPIHKGDNNTSFSIFRDGSWRCFKCGAFGDMARLLSRLQNITIQQARAALGSAANIPVRVDIAEIPELPSYEERNNLPKYDTMREAILGAYRKYCPTYLLDRGFSKAILKTYEVGYDQNRYKIVLPVRDVHARLVGLTFRLDFDKDTDQPAKYWHDNFLKSLHLYGFHLWAGKKVKRLFLVEGQLDAQRMNQLGHAAVGVMGSDLSFEQRALLLRHCKAEQIVLAFDNDEAGAKATRLAIRRLAPTPFGPKLATLVYTTKDPGELDAGSRLRLRPWYKTSITGE